MEYARIRDRDDFDAYNAAVLVDGPCSGTGVGRHHPEGRWRLRPDTLARNSELDADRYALQVHERLYGYAGMEDAPL